MRFTSATQPALDAALVEDVELIILDLNLPLLPGEEVLRRLRMERPQVPVIVLSAKDGIDDRVDNLNAGADDYLTKPFSFAELLARVQARFRDRALEPGADLEHGRGAGRGSGSGSSPGTSCCCRSRPQ
ncbi:MAG: response regulator [Nitriliruptoraceae bacterium]